MADEVHYHHHENKAIEPCEAPAVVKTEESLAVEASDRGLFGFVGKKEEVKKCDGEEVLICSQFEEKVQVCEEKKEEEKKHEGLLQKLHRSSSSSSSFQHWFSTQSIKCQHMLQRTPLRLWRTEKRLSAADRCLHTSKFSGKSLTNYKWAKIAAATNNFSPLNLIGQGGIGCVYKAVLSGGQIVAVKRIAPSHRQGPDELKNEVLLLPKLKHKNIIQLLGYCTHGEERILVYEFMENRSLDILLVECLQLQWSVCFNIILGIARGTAYLHEDSRLRIHGDLKPSNILLDSDFSPKITGIAKAHDHQSGVELQVDWACGYVSPEYALEQKASYMSDVYAFGVIVLQILSGRKSHVYQYGRSLVSYASKLWNEGRAMELVDDSITWGGFSAEALRCIEISLSCTQQEPRDRPTMADVLKFLGGEEQPVEISDSSPSRGYLDLRNILPGGFHGNAILPELDLATLSAATDKFSSSNMIGRGGFGKTYKGILDNGQTVAVKRLSTSSARGASEFKKEISFLSNLQHRNIVKLLGFCRHGEKLLVYEFMECSGLDSWIFDKTHRRLQWELRLKIILGIARGVLYLQQDSGLKIIHGDIKPSNILLDVEMNPKISDFGIAKAMEEHESEIETSQVAGTLGYISPEYILERKLSLMSDVYGFGVTVLEIVSGRKNFAPELDKTNLVAYAWELWNEDKALDLVDESLGGAFPAEAALRCIKLGLLCTQQKPHHRPTMASAIKVLEGEELSLELQENGPPNNGTSFDNFHFDVTDATFEYDDILER